MFLQVIARGLQSNTLNKHGLLMQGIMSHANRYKFFVNDVYSVLVVKYRYIYKSVIRFLLYIYIYL